MAKYSSSRANHSHESYFYFTADTALSIFGRNSSSLRLSYLYVRGLRNGSTSAKHSRSDLSSISDRITAITPLCVTTSAVDCAGLFEISTKKSQTLDTKFSVCSPPGGVNRGSRLSYSPNARG